MSKDNCTFSAADRLHLIQTLNALPAPQFNELVFALNEPKGNLPSNSAPQGDRSIALLNWIESPIGPGLRELEMVLASLMGNQVQTIEPPATHPTSFEALREIIQTLSQNQTPRYDLREAQFAGSFAETVHGNQIGGVINNYSQNPDSLSLLRNVENPMAQPTDYHQMVLDTIANALTNDPNPTVRAKAAESLGKLGDQAVTPLLLTALADSHLVVQCSAIQALGHLGNEAAIPQLLQVLENGATTTRQAAAAALGHIGSEAAIPGLLNALNDQAPAVRGTAASVLGAMGVEVAIPALLNLLTDSDPTVEAHAVEAIGAIGSQLAIDTLVELVADPNPYLRQNAAIALSKLGRKDTIPMLVRLLQDPDAAVRETAVDALGTAAQDYSVA